MGEVSVGTGPGDGAAGTAAEAPGTAAEAPGPDLLRREDLNPCNGFHPSPLMIRILGPSRDLS